MREDELPEGWATSRIDQVCQRITDGTHFSPKDQSRRGAYMYITAKNIREWGLDLSDMTYVSEAVHRPIFLRCNPEKGDVLYIKDGATAGIAILNPVEDEFSLLSSVALLKPDRSKLDPSFLKWYLMSPVGRKAMLDQVTGSAITRLTLEIIRNSVMPVPPLSEQKRIVAKVEELLASVNAARDLLARVPAILKRFRQAVLVSAFSEEVSAEWDDARGGDLFSFVTTGSRGWAQYYAEEGALFLRVGNLNHESVTLDFRKVQHVRPPKTKEAERTRVLPNDILITVTADVGMIGVVPPGLQEAYVNQHVAIARPAKGVNVEYLAWYLTSSEGGQRQFLESQRGATKAGLGLDDIRSLEVPVPSRKEQDAIVTRIQVLFALADAIEKRVAATTVRADKLTQAILAKAFRGELAFPLGEATGDHPLRFPLARRRPGLR